MSFSIKQARPARVNLNCVRVGAPLSLSPLPGHAGPGGHSSLMRMARSRAERLRVRPGPRPSRLTRAGRRRHRHGRGGRSQWPLGGRLRRSEPADSESIRVNLPRPAAQARHVDAVAATPPAAAAGRGLRGILQEHAAAGTGGQTETGGQRSTKSINRGSLRHVKIRSPRLRLPGQCYDDRDVPVHRLQDHIPIIPCLCAKFG